MHIARQEVDGLLPRCVVTEHHMAVRVDQAGGDRRALRVDDDLAGLHLGGQVRPATDRGDGAVDGEDGVGVRDDRLLVVAGQDGGGADDGDAAHDASPELSPEVASATVIPPTRALIRPRLATAAMTTSSSGWGASGMRTVIAS
jgi:hypothetical protein